MRTIGLLPGFWSTSFDLEPVDRALRSAGLMSSTISLTKTRHSTVASYVQQTVSQSTELKASILIGHSLGGLLAVKTAELWPEITKLVLISPPGPAGISPVRNLHQFAGITKTLPRLLNHEFRPAYAVAEKLLFNEHQRLGLDWDYDKLISREPTLAFLSFFRPGIRLSGPISVPTLFITAEADRIVDQRTVKAFHEQYGGDRAELFQAGQHDHFSLLRDPVVLSKIISFIEADL